MMWCKPGHDSYAETVKAKAIVITEKCSKRSRNWKKVFCLWKLVNHRLSAWFWQEYTAIPYTLFLVSALHHCCLALQAYFETGLGRNWMHIIWELEYVHCKSISAFVCSLFTTWIGTHSLMLACYILYQFNYFSVKCCLSFFPIVLQPAAEK